jgi:hypothetical protein
MTEEPAGMIHRYFFVRGMTYPALAWTTQKVARAGRALGEVRLPDDSIYLFNLRARKRTGLNIFHQSVIARIFV